MAVEVLANHRVHLRGFAVVSTTKAMSDADPAIGATGDRLRAAGWDVTELVEPDDERPWVYAVDGDDTLIVWSSPRDYSRPGDILRMEVRLGDCYLLATEPGAAVEPNCGRGGWQQCSITTGRLRSR